MLNKLNELNTAPFGKYKTRILAELRFAGQLSEKTGLYAEELEKAVAYLTAEYEKSGAVTKELAEETEKILKPFGPLAKKYKVVHVAHAHIDMNWQWGFDETVGVTVDTFRTMLDIMKEYPDYTFAQSQASVYKIVEDYAPGMLEEIRERVKEGRWEITAATWVETDKNMPSGESLTRHIIYTKQYLSNLFNLPSDYFDLDFEPDTFGHNINVPEICAAGGVKYYYHCRGKDSPEILFNWKSPSGAELLVYNEPHWYNADINDEISDYVIKIADATKLDTLLKVYGVGDHGGGPTRRDIERIIEMGGWPVYPQMVFGTFRDYFKEAEKVKSLLPTLEGEFNFAFDGCYTTQTRIKAGNRKSEGLLYEAEAYNALSSLDTGFPYVPGDYGEAWKKVLFSHFHDIITGSGVIETREYAGATYQEVFARAETGRKLALQAISANIDTESLIKNITSESLNSQLSTLNSSRAQGAGAGQGAYEAGAGKNRVYHVFNPCVYPRTDTVEITVWDYDGDEDRLIFTGENGKTVESQLIDDGHYWGHDWAKYLVRAEIPALGYISLVTEEKEEELDLSVLTGPRVQYDDRFILENKYIKAEFDTLDGSLKTFIDKESGENLVDGAKGGAFRLVDEAERKSFTGWNGGMSSWVTGRYKNIEKISGYEISPVLNGGIANAIKFETSFRNSALEYYVYLKKDSRSLEFDVKCDWLEAGKRDVGVPQLQYYAPLAYNCDKYKYDIPFGVIVRGEMDIDNPGNSFALGDNAGGPSVMLATASKYGFRCFENAVIVDLIRGSFDPDPFPELCRHKFKFALGIAPKAAANSDLIKSSFDYNHPLFALSSKIHGGTLPASAEGVRLENGNVIISALKMPECGCNDTVVLRFHEADGKEQEVCFDMARKVKEAYFTDANENRTDGGAVRSDGNKVWLTAGAYKSCTVAVVFG